MTRNFSFGILALLGTLFLFASCENTKSILAAPERFDVYEVLVFDLLEQQSTTVRDVLAKTESHCQNQNDRGDDGNHRDDACHTIVAVTYQNPDYQHRP